MRWIAENIGAGAIQAIGGVIAISAGAALVAFFLLLPSPVAVFVVVLVVGVALFVLGTTRRSRAAGRVRGRPSEGRWEDLAEELRRQREVVREHYAGLDQIIGPRPLRTGPPIYVPRTAKQSEPHRYFLNDAVTARVLVERLKGSTSVQAKAVIREYVGAWMRVEGEVADIVEPLANTLLVTLRISEPDRHMALHDLNVLAHFDPEWRDRAIRLPKGVVVSIVGRLADASAELGGSVSLEHAEIVS